MLTFHKVEIDLWHYDNGDREYRVFINGELSLETCNAVNVFRILENTGNIHDFKYTEHFESWKSFENHS